MPELAKKVIVDHARDKLFIDGIEFPLYIAEDGPKVHEAEDHNGYIVMIPIIAESIEIIHAKSMGVQAAELRVESARRALADAHLHVQDANVSLQHASAELATAKDADKR